MKVTVQDLNKALICKLCNGYFRDCQTIPECMHTFCKPCLIRHLFPEGLSPRQNCPSCDAHLGQFPLDKIIPDRNIQAIVDRLYPLLTALAEEIEEGFEKRPLLDGAQSSNNKKARIDSDNKDGENKETAIIKVVPKTLSESHRNLPSLAKPSFQMKLNVNMKKVKKEISKRLALLSCTIEADDILLFLRDEELSPDTTIEQCLKILQDQDGSSAPLILHYVRNI